MVRQRVDTRLQDLELLAPRVTWTSAKLIEARLDVIQLSDKAIIDWRQFSIDPSEHTNFQQPSASAAARRIRSSRPAPSWWPSPTRPCCATTTRSATPVMTSSPPSVPVMVVWGRQQDVETAAREIVLVAQDLASYGKDRPDELGAGSIVPLVDAVASAVDRVRQDWEEKRDSPPFIDWRKRLQAKAEAES